MPGDFSTSARAAPTDVSAAAVARQVRKRVVFIINSLAGGGAERVICTLLRASQDELRDSQISLLLLDREAAMYEVPRWVEVEQLDCGHSLVRSIWSVWRALRRAMSRPSSLNLAHVHDSSPPVRGSSTIPETGHFAR